MGIQFNISNELSLQMFYFFFFFLKCGWLEGMWSSFWHLLVVQKYYLNCSYSTTIEKSVYFLMGQIFPGVVGSCSAETWSWETFPKTLCFLSKCLCSLDKKEQLVRTWELRGERWGLWNKEPGKGKQPVHDQKSWSVLKGYVQVRMGRNQRIRVEKKCSREEFGCRKR